MRSESLIGLQSRFVCRPLCQGRFDTGDVPRKCERREGLNQRTFLPTPLLFRALRLPDVLLRHEGDLPAHVQSNIFRAIGQSRAHIVAFWPVPNGEAFLALVIPTVWQAVAAYFLVGAVVCFAHPLLLRQQLAELKTDKFQSQNIFVKPMVGFVICFLYITLWPIAWFNAGKSEKKAIAARDAQYERLQQKVLLYGMMKAKERARSKNKFAGGDGSSFAEAIVVRNANLLSGPRAESEFIEKHYPGSEVKRQSLQQQNERKYDVFEFMTVDGRNKTLYFDISDSFRTGFL